MFNKRDDGDFLMQRKFSQFQITQLPLTIAKHTLLEANDKLSYIVTKYS